MHQSAEVEMADIGALIKATAKTVAKIRADAMIESASTRGRHVLKAKADAWDQLVAMVAGG
jgi:hypothetical protein